MSIENAIKIIFFYFFLFNSFSGKAQLFYIPDAGLNTLGYSAKGDFKLAYFASEPNLGSKFIVGYSPIKNWAFSVGYLYTNKEIQFGGRFEAFNNDLFALGIINYKTLKEGVKNEKERKLQLISRLGYSIGRVEGRRNGAVSEFYFQKIFGEMGLDYQFGGGGACFALKYNYIDYLKGQVNGDFMREGFTKPISDIESGNSFRTVELKFQVYIGNNYVKILAGGALEMRASDNASVYWTGGRPHIGLLLEVDKIHKYFKEKKK